MDIVNSSMELRGQVSTYLNQKNIDSKPVIVAWGLMNAGKSYLLNMLTQHIDSEFFKTNDFRETAENHQFEGDDRIYLDTPGLDANSQDNLVALEGVQQADVVLFVHQLQGELEAVEIEFLQNVRDSFGEYAQSHILMVLSKVDKEEPEKVDQIQERILEQCHTHLGFQPLCFQISNTYYQQGIQGHIDDLVQYSHIEDLNETLSVLLDESVVAVRQQRSDQMKATLLASCLQMADSLEQVIEQKSQAFNEDIDNLEKRITSLVSVINQKSKEYQNI